MDEHIIREEPETKACGLEHPEHEHEHEHHEHEYAHEHEHEHGHHHHHGHDHEDGESCGCGHDHEHEHEHHHHHDHDEESCGCGHDHEHEHHHHHHDHDHHHHDHGHQYDVPGFRVFETHSHEGATICSFEKDVRKDKAEVVSCMEQSIHALEQWLDETDAVIGHVKGYVKETGSVTTFSTVGCGLNVEQHEGDTICVGFAAIVIGPAEEDLKNKVAEIFTAL